MNHLPHEYPVRLLQVGDELVRTNGTVDRVVEVESADGWVEIVTDNGTELRSSRIVPAESRVRVVWGPGVVDYIRTARP